MRVILGSVLALLLGMPMAFAQESSEKQEWKEYELAGQAIAIDEVCHLLKPLNHLALGATYLDSDPGFSLLRASIDANIDGTGEAIAKMGCDHKDAAQMREFATRSGESATRLWLAYGEAVAAIGEKESWAARPFPASSAKLGAALAAYLPADPGFAAGLRQIAGVKARQALAAVCDRSKPGCPAAPADLKRSDAERWLAIVAGIAKAALQ
jgi:hypothetical protein